MLRRVRMRCATALALLVASLNAAHGAGRKLDPELKDLTSDQTIDVIVQYRSAPTAADHHRVLARGGQLKHNLDIIRAAHYSLPASNSKRFLKIRMSSSSRLIGL
jgi:hypothetical protein